MEPILEYVSGYEQVQIAFLVMVMVLGAVFMFFRRLKQREKLISDDSRQKDAREFQQQLAKVNRQIEEGT